jgi:hypothetical protein
MRGAVALEKSWLAKDSNRNVVVYVVWSSQLGAKEKNVGDATRLVPGPRARHYWDPDDLVGSAYEPVLGLPVVAWDTWMLFAKDAVWRDSAPPKPAWWEHQLGRGPPSLHLDPDRFASRAADLEAR